MAMASSISTSVLGTFILGLHAGSVVAVAKQPAEVLYSVLFLVVKQGLDFALFGWWWVPCGLVHGNRSRMCIWTFLRG